MRRRWPLAALLVLTAVLGIFWTSAGAFGAVRLDGYQKYYKVAASYQGRPENLAEIADRFLGGSGRSPEIFDLNAGRRQPDGGTLTDPSKLHAGWYLVLPWTRTATGCSTACCPPLRRPRPAQEPTRWHRHMSRPAGHRRTRSRRHGPRAVRVPRTRPAAPTSGRRCGWPRTMRGATAGAPASWSRSSTPGWTPACRR